jgi:hypothetical protein
VEKKKYDLCFEVLRRFSEAGILDREKNVIGISVDGIRVHLPHPAAYDPCLIRCRVNGKNKLL